METNNETNHRGYLLLFRGNDWARELSPAEMQGVMDNWMKWFEGLSQAGKIKAADPLITEGRIVSGPKGQNIIDGPFAESKEAIGGYFLLQNVTYDEAVSAAKNCPALEHGLVVEVRPLAEVCPLAEMAGATTSMADRL